MKRVGRPAQIGVIARQPGGPTWRRRLAAAVVGQLQALEAAPRAGAGTQQRAGTRARRREGIGAGTGVRARARGRTLATGRVLISAAGARGDEVHTMFGVEPDSERASERGFADFGV